MSHAGREGSGFYCSQRTSRAPEDPAMKYRTPRLALLLAFPLVLASVIGCSSSSDSKKDATAGSGGSGGTGGTGGVDAAPSDGPRDGSADLGPAGGMVPGPADMHCKPDDTITVKEASCDLGPLDGGSEEGDGGEPEPATHNNAEADDDDCKYHIKWISTPIRLNQDVTFTVTVTDKADGKGIAFPSRGKFDVA